MLPTPQFPLQLNEEQKGFRPGDIVSWCGVAGKVMFERKGMVYVKFVNHITASFLFDGRYTAWHVEASLKSCTEEELKKQALEYYERKNA